MGSGRKPNREDITTLLSEIDPENDGEISYGMFMAFISKARSTGTRRAKTLGRRGSSSDMFRQLFPKVLVYGEGERTLAAHDEAHNLLLTEIHSKKKFARERLDQRLRRRAEAKSSEKRT